MPNNFSIKQAADYWKAGKAFEAGRLIFENLHFDTRPKWAKTILEHVIRRTENRSEPILQILRIANNRSEWSAAHRAFSAIRDATLELDQLKMRAPDEKLFLAQLCLAEDVAKVIYNATNPPDPFDEDSGWGIVVCLKEVLDLLADNDFAESMWKILSKPMVPSRRRHAKPKTSGLDS